MSLSTQKNTADTPLNMTDITEFLLELDALKRVNRRSYVPQTTRLENSAEHSWHLAMACWSIAELFELEVNHEKLLKLALVHDLGEIDSGDTFLYDSSRSEAHIEEREGIVRLQAHSGNGIDNLLEVWDEQETGSSPETQLLKAIDRLLPFLLNLNAEGKTWSEHGVKRSQVAAMHAFIADSFPVIHEWIEVQLDYASEQGWLVDA